MSKYNRRDILRAGMGAAIAWPAGVTLFSTSAQAADPSGQGHLTWRLNASSIPSPPLIDFLHMGTARSADGHTLTADSRSLRRDGVPWLPVMGEFHYARCPDAEWRDALLRMKAGGVAIVSSYVFWIHHEEVQGSWDWSGRRSLRGFAQACRDVGLSLIVRCGPWAHGEVRNGGFPDWVQHSGVRLRSTDPAFLNLVRPLYAQIAAQLEGLLWKDSGPVVGIQVDNEYHGSAEYLLALKAIARASGLDVPFYTRTGWPALSTPVPLGELLPLFGSYPDGFWDRKLVTMPGSYGDAFRFILARGASAAAMGAGGAARPAGDDAGPYPYLCCEIGGGMETSYHRRIRIFPMDILSLGLVKIGSGNNLQGYYMYHGGTNPDGKLSDLQETQATGGYNDLPVKTYDFFAPLGEFDQAHPHYHLLRRMHLFLADWGLSLASMPAHLPDIAPVSAKDTTTLRWTARTDGTSGYVFVNNYQRFQTMPAKAGGQFHVALPGGLLTFPDVPVTVPADSAFFWPFGLDLVGVTLAYATAQPVCHLTDGNIYYVIFSETPGVPAEFVFDGAGAAVSSPTGTVTHAGSRVHVRQIKPGPSAAVHLQTGNGGQVHVILLDEARSLGCWKGTLGGREHLFLTPADLTLDGNTVRLRSADPAEMTLSVLPDATFSHSGRKLRGNPDGLFRRYSLPAPPGTPMAVTPEVVQTPGPARAVPMGQAGVAAEPADADFEQAAVWRLHLSPGGDAGRDLLLRIRYTGDVARLYLDGKLLDDNFFNDAPFEVGLKRYAPGIYRGVLLLKVLPLRKDAPIYLQAWPAFGGSDTVCTLDNVALVERHEGQLQAV